MSASQRHSAALGKPHRMMLALKHSTQIRGAITRHEQAASFMACGLMWTSLGLSNKQFRLIKIYHMTEYFDSGWVDFCRPDLAAHARACGANGYSVSGEDEFEVAFKDALTSGKPCVIDAKIRRLAIPHFSTSPRGTIAGTVERMEERMRGADKP